MIQTQIIEQVELFYKHELKNSAGKVDLLLVRIDGVIIFSTKSDAKKNVSIGVLAAGLWQAAASLSELNKKDQNVNDYRLGFDTSSSGIYTIATDFKNQKVLLVAIYDDVVNPGPLKIKLKTLAVKIESQEKIKTQDKEQNNKFLFNNITDDEIDSLFLI